MEVSIDKSSGEISQISTPQIEKRRNSDTDNTASCSEKTDSNRNFSNPSAKISIKENENRKIPTHRQVSGTSVKSSRKRGRSILLNKLSRNSLQLASSFWTSIEGIVYAFLSAFFFSLTLLIVKQLNQVNPGLKAFFRFLAIFLFSLPMVYDYGSMRPARLHFWALLRGVAGGLSIYLRYWSIGYLPLANATVIIVSMPVFVSIFSRVFLGEKCGVFHIFSIGITLLDLTIMTKSGDIFNESHRKGQNSPLHGINGQNGLIYDYQEGMLAMGAGLVAALIGSASYVLIRQMKYLHHSIILFDFGWVAMIECAGLTYFFDLPQICAAPWMLMILGVSSFYAQFLLTKALKVEEAGLVSVTRSASEVFLAFVYQIFIFHQFPDRRSIAGAVLITLAVILNGVRKYVAILPPEHWCRIIFAFTLR